MGALGPVIRVLALIVQTVPNKTMSAFARYWKELVWMVWTVLLSSLLLAVTRLLMELVLFAAAPGRAHPLHEYV